MKQAIASSGANETKNHIKEISLSAFFLMEAAKKTDREFWVTEQSRAHTVRDAAADCKRMVRHSMDSTAITGMHTRTQPTLTDPTERGWQAMCSPGWIEKMLSKSAAREAHEDVSGIVVDLDYELHDATLV